VKRAVGFGAQYSPKSILYGLNSSEGHFIVEKYLKGMLCNLKCSEEHFLF
jgi:hypothetical protein